MKWSAPRQWGRCLAAQDGALGAGKPASTGLRLQRGSQLPLSSRGRAGRSTAPRRALKPLYLDDDRGSPGSGGKRRRRRSAGSSGSSDLDCKELDRAAAARPGAPELEIADSEGEGAAAAARGPRPAPHDPAAAPTVARMAGATQVAPPLKRLRKAAPAPAAAPACAARGDDVVGFLAQPGACDGDRAGSPGAVARRAAGWESDSEDSRGGGAPGCAPAAEAGGRAGEACRAGSWEGPNGEGSNEPGAAAARRANPFLSARTLERGHPVAASLPLLAEQAHLSPCECSGVPWDIVLLHGSSRQARAMEPGCRTPAWLALTTPLASARRQEVRHPQRAPRPRPGAAAGQAEALAALLAPPAPPATEPDVIDLASDDDSGGAAAGERAGGAAGAAGGARSRRASPGGAHAYVGAYSAAALGTAAGAAPRDPGDPGSHALPGAARCGPSRAHAHVADGPSVGRWGFQDRHGSPALAGPAPREPSGAAGGGCAAARSPCAGGGGPLGAAGRLAGGGAVREPPWWHRLPDFVPVAALRGGVDPRRAASPPPWGPRAGVLLAWGQQCAGAVAALRELWALASRGAASQSRAYAERPGPLVDACTGSWQCRRAGFMMWRCMHVGGLAALAAAASS